MPGSARFALLTALALLAFAGNSLLCRLALADGGTDPAMFTAWRLLAGGTVLAPWFRRDAQGRRPGDPGSALALFAYAAAFSWAYVSLGAATGALLLFAAVQAGMLLGGLWAGTRWSARQAAGLGLALAGVAWLLWPGLDAPPAGAAALMLLAGLAWAAYTLRGRGAGDPLRATAGNFVRAAPLALGLGLFALHGPGGPAPIEAAGLAYALASGALCSGLGYAVWYAALRGLSPQAAGSTQLAVPVITALLAWPLLGEMIGLRWALAAAAVLGGIALTLPRRRTG